MEDDLYLHQFNLGFRGASQDWSVPESHYQEYRQLEKQEKAHKDGLIAAGCDFSVDELETSSSVKDSPTLSRYPPKIVQLLALPFSDCHSEVAMQVAHPLPFQDNHPHPIWATIILKMMTDH